MTVIKFDCSLHEVCEGIKSINACVLMPGVIKPEVMHVSHENGTFVPSMKQKVVFVFSNQLRAKPRAKQVSFLLFYSIKTVFDLFNTLRSL